MSAGEATSCNENYATIINDTPHLIKLADIQAFENEPIALNIHSKKKYTFVVPGSMLKMKIRYHQGAITPSPAASLLPDTFRVKISELIAAGKHLQQGQRLVHRVSADKALIVKHTPLIGPFCRE